MNISIRFWLVAWAMMALLGLAQAAQAKDYTVRGADIASGKPYTGRVSITITDGVADVAWDIGVDHYTGSGVADGDVLAIYFNPGYNAVALYRLNRTTGVYKGKWTALGSGTTSTEDWTPIK